MNFFKKSNYINIVIFLIYVFYLMIILFFIFYDGIAKKGSSGVSGFIEQDALRKSLGDWYQLVFYTFHINIYFVISGIFYSLFPQNKIAQNMIFCSSSYMLLCFFAMLVFRFDSFSYNFYEASKTLFVHCISPLTALILIYFLRTKIFLSWRALWINSLYITLFIILSLIIYFNFTFAEDTLYPGQHLWIYGFLDYDKQIMFINLPNFTWMIVGITITILISPFVGMTIFMFFKYLLNIKMNPIIKCKNKQL